MELREQIIDYIQEHAMDSSANAGVDISTISEHFGLWKNDASKILNQLLEEGLLQKTSARPIRYVCSDRTTPLAPAAEPEQLPFSRMVGYDGSLKFQTQLASAAVSYPPHGIHTLVTGETGVGKSLMASEMARYLNSLQKGSKAAPFVSFNCAEYADNPQLLLAQLFGYVKGAFTGADRDRTGMVEKADNGILFLDEIHRLPATGQEMLFSLIDNNTYRRLGDTAERTVRLMIVGATTEDADNALIHTFRRRMPVTIQIPVLSERPINERLDIICRFLSAEAAELGIPIRVTYLALKLLASFRSESNIGELKNEIRISCARSYLKYVQQSGVKETPAFLSIDIYSLSRKLSIRYLSDDRVDRYFSVRGLEQGILINPKETISFSASERAPSLKYDPNHFFENGAFAYEDPGSRLEAERLVVADLEAPYVEDAQPCGGHNASGMLYGSIAPMVWSATNELIRHASKEFEQQYDQEITNSVAYYLQQIKFYANAGRILFSPSSFDNSSDYAKEQDFIRKMLPMLKATMNIDIMDGEIMLLAMLLAHKANDYEQPDASLLLIGYGDVPTDVAAFANSLLNTSFIRAFCIPINADLETVHVKLSRFFENIPNRALILCGFGLTNMIVQSLRDSACFDYRVIPLLDPMIALESGRLILTTHGDLSEITKKILAECNAYLGRALPETSDEPAESAMTPATPQDTDSNSDMRDVIITYCITGTGSARIAREILLRNLSVCSAADILPLGIMDDIFSMSRRLGKRLKLIVGIMNPNIPGIPFLSIEKILYAKDLDELLRIQGLHLSIGSSIETEEINRMPLDARLAHISEHLSYFAPSLNANQVDLTARQIIRQLRNRYHTELSPDLVVRIYIHCAAMFERVATAEPVPMPLDGYAEVEHNYAAFQALKTILTDCCKEMGLPIVDAEAYYFMMTLPSLSEVSDGA